MEGKIVHNDVRTPTQTRMDARKVGETCGFAPVDCTGVCGLVLLVCCGACCSGGELEEGYTGAVLFFGF